MTRMPTAFVPHGGGPWPIIQMTQLPEDERSALSAYMRSIAQTPTPPKALLVVSAHWEEDVPTVSTNPSPELYFDYYNFPAEAYELTWPAPGDPELARQVGDLLRGAGFGVSENATRGFDHGTFIPLMLAYPDAQVPVVQLSLQETLDAAEHFAMGRALQPLRDEGVYILGSGNSYHNLRAIFSQDSSQVPTSREFDTWLNAAVVAGATERQSHLEHWSDAPAARESHPGEEHLIPLMVAAGAAGEDAGYIEWEGTMVGMKLSAHRFG